MLKLRPDVCRLLRLSLTSFIGSLVTSSLLYAQFNPDQGQEITDIHPPDVIHWQPAGGRVFADGTVEVGLRLFTEMQFTLYTDKVSFSAPGYQLQELKPPATQRLHDPISDQEVDVYGGGDFMLYLRPLSEGSPQSVKVNVTYLGCTSRICLFPYTETVEVPVYRTNADSPLGGEVPPAEIIGDAQEPQGQRLQSSSESMKPVVGSVEERWASQVIKGEYPWFILALIVLLGGLATNLTPCVAPMLPITLRLLSNQKLPLLSSSLYALGIMVTYTALGSVAVLSGSAFGTFMQSSVVNLVFALAMAGLGLSMLGFGDLSKIQNIGSRLGAGKPSAKNTFLMGAGAGLVAAPCTGPVLGALLTYTAAQQNSALGLLLMAVYSFGFALPYVLLGTAATKAGTMRVPHYLQLFIKVGFGAVMFGLALYYLRVPFYDLVKMIKPFYGVIAVAALSAGTIVGVIWLFSTRWHHNRTLMAGIAVVLGLGLFSGSQWLTQSESSELNWYKDMDSAFAAANKTRKPILIDNWAEWCEACKKMDVTTFADQAVVAELNDNWILLKLDLTEGSDEDDQHMETYRITGLPTLVMLPSTSDVNQAENIVGYVSAAGLLAQMKAFQQQRD